MTRPLAVLVGFVGKIPLAGMSVFNLHYIAGLQDCGYDVHYVECENVPGDYYDPVANEMTRNVLAALPYAHRMLARVGIAAAQISQIDHDGQCHGSGWGPLRAALNRADFLLSIGEAAWSDEFARCKRRAFIDCDPLFTQAAMLDPNDRMNSVVRSYDTLYTWCMRMGMHDCEVPTLGLKWRPAEAMISTRHWTVAPHRPNASLTAVMNWTSGSDVTLNGKVYGYKNREFAQVMNLPAQTTRPCVLAVGGAAPKAALKASGWQLANPLEVTGTIEAYDEFIANSHADLGIAKHAYVAARTGWFSDRSTCFMASGRPVVHQDTGFEDWLPTGAGVLRFRNIEELLDALAQIETDYAHHSRAARAMAEEHFEAKDVMGRILDSGGLR